MVSSLFSEAYFAEVRSSVQQTRHEGNPTSQKDPPDFSLILFVCLSQRPSSCHLKTILSYLLIRFTNSFTIIFLTLRHQGENVFPGQIVLLEEGDRDSPGVRGVDLILVLTVALPQEEQVFVHSLQTKNKVNLEKNIFLYTA